MAYLPQQKYLYAPGDWDTGWRAALRASASAPVNIACIGDSFSYGSPSVTNFMTKPWWALFRADLLTKYTHGGDFWTPAHSQEYLTQYSATFNGTPPLTSINATNRGFYNQAGYGNMVGWNAATAANLWTFLTPYACTDIDIITLDWSTGNWTYTVDGGATQTVTIASTTNPQTIRRTQITGLANTTHTVICTGANAALSHFLLGVACYKSRTTGLRFNWAAVSGYTVGTYTLGVIPSGGQYYIWQGRSGASTTGFGFPSEPDLAIIALGINDCVNPGIGYGLEGYQAGLRRLWQAIRRAKPSCSLLFVAHSNPDGDNSDVTTPFVNSLAWPLYIDKMANIAIDSNAGLVNMHAKWGETGVTDGRQLAADPHPTDAGHVDLNTTLAAIL